MMELDKKVEELIPRIVAGLDKCRTCPVGTQADRGLTLAGQDAVHEVLADLISILFPGCHSNEMVKEDGLHGHLDAKLKSAAARLQEQIRHAVAYQCSIEGCEDCGDCDEKANEVVTHMIEYLPSLQDVLQRDIIAGYEGDPAAKSTMEVVMSYPGLYAIIVHRIAHVLYKEDTPLIPRIMSEYAHSRTGIDIHPGATIGPGFFIDHGTGVVIGETSVIGKNVKLYQGVTLGALSFPKDEDGNPIKGVKRHPNVEDGVVIYSGATILGNVTIGPGAVIGGNVWLTHDVPAKARVYNQQPRPLILHHGDDQTFLGSHI